MSNSISYPVAAPPSETISEAAKFNIPGGCDSHIHMVAREPAFPLWENRVESPAPGTLDEWIARFETLQRQLGLSRAIIVHSILYGQDNSVTLETLKRLGPDRVRGVGLVPDGTQNEKLAEIAAAGIKAIRLNYVHGGVLSWEGACQMSPLLADNNLHIEMLLHTQEHMIEIGPIAQTLPVPVVFDHIGWPDVSLGVNDPGFKALLELLEKGKAWVKLSAIYRMVGNEFDGAEPFLSALIEANPNRCLWGSDWPHLMLADAPMPDAGLLLAQLSEIAGKDTLKTILVENPETLYGFSPEHR